MVTEWGMSSLGPLSFGKVEQEMFLGREIAKRVDYSEETAQKIDQEVKQIVLECYQKAKGLIERHIDTLHTIAQRLLEKEVIDGSEIDAILAEAVS